MTSNWKQRTMLVSSVLLLVAAIVVHGIGKGEFDYNVDESQHTATGLFISSLLHDRPLRHPVAYTYRYYAQYPALSGIIHWPPLFYSVEGIMFLAFGASVVTARMTILLFALAGWFFWFRWCSETLGDWAAVFSTLTLAMLPSTLLFEKAVMLEIPCLALCIIALYYWYRYLTEEEQAHLYFFAGFLAAALLTKQSSIFIPLVCLLTTALLGKWRLVLNRRVLGPLALLVVAVSPFYALVYAVHWKTISMDLLGQEGSRAGHYQLVQFGQSLLFYLKVIPAQLGWPFFILTITGILSYRLWSRREPAAFMLAWVAGVYITFTAIHHKEARYSFFWIPPFTYFVAGVLTAKWRARPLRVLAAALAVILSVQAVVTGWNYRRPYVEGYASLVSRIRSISDSGVILFDAPLPANFIFFLRKMDQQRRFVVLRKALWVTRINLSGGSEELAKTVADVDKVVDQDGVKYVVVSDAPTVFEGQRSLQTLVHTDTRFELLGTFPIESNQREWQNRHLLLYRNNRLTVPATRSLTVRMLTLPHDVVVPWEDLGQPQQNKAMPSPSQESP